MDENEKLIIENKNSSNWDDLVEVLESLESDKYIFRGHSNDYVDGKTKPWGITSSFGRKYKGKYFFNSWVSQQFNWHYLDYNYTSVREIQKANVLERIYYFQHHGVPTCMIDFTKDPLIALYFAISNVNMSSGMKNPEPNGRSTEYPGGYVTINAIDYKYLMQILHIEPLRSENFPLKYEIYRDWRSDVGLGIDLDPLSNCSLKDENFNMKEQQGCFLLFDVFRNYNKNESLELFLSDYVKTNKVKLERPLIKKYHLDYNEVPSCKQSSGRTQSLFNFLELKHKTGKYLFDDIQGIKYDLNFFHNKQ